MIARYLLFILVLLAFPWALRTWWKMRRAAGPRERAFIGRTSVSTWLLLAVAAVIVGTVGARVMIFAVPVIAVVGLGIRHSWQKTRARIQSEESDPLSRAKRVN